MNSSEKFNSIHNSIGLVHYVTIAGYCNVGIFLSTFHLQTIPSAKNASHPGPFNGDTWSLRLSSYQHKVSQQSTVNAAIFDSDI